MALSGATITGLSTSFIIPATAIGTCVSTLFAPSLTAAAGGTAAVAGAAVSGLAIAFLPSVYCFSMAALSSNLITKIGFSVLGAASCLGGIAFGGALFGLSLGTLLPFIGLGVAIAAAGTLLTAGLSILCLLSFAGECRDDMTNFELPLGLHEPLGNLINTYMSDRTEPADVIAPPINK